MARHKRQPVVRPNPFVTKAQQLAVLKYGPEISGIAGLQRQAQQDYRTMVQNAQGSRKATQAAIDRATPQIDQAYQGAAQQLGNINGIVDQDLSKIGPVSGQSAALQQAIQLERQNASSGLATLQGAANQSLQQQGIDAVTGQRAAVKAAKQQRSDTYGQLLNRLSDLATERGTFVSQTAQDLASAQSAAAAKAASEAADRSEKLLEARIAARTSRANSQRTAENSQRSSQATIKAARIRAGASRDTAEIRAAQKAGLPKGVKPATPSQQGGFQDEVGKAVQYAKQFRNDGRKRPDSASLLLKGRNSQTISRPVNGQVQKVTIPKVPSFDQLAASVALDLAYDGRVSNANVRKLRQRGYNVKGFGWKYNAKPVNTRKRAQDAAKIVQAGAGSDTLARLLGLLGG